MDESLAISMADRTGGAEATADRPMLVLASTSARRRALLEGAGYRFAVMDPGVDDGRLTPGRVEPHEWAVALAYLKAWAVLDRVRGARGRGSALVLGADTICVQDGRIIGQPRDGGHAGRMIRSFVDREHEVITGVALIDASSGRRDLFADRARVRFRAISNAQIDAYVATGQWEGKAGGYNLHERLDAGWPIEYSGDATTIVGLPMDRLRANLTHLVCAA